MRKNQRSSQERVLRNLARRLRESFGEEDEESGNDSLDVQVDKLLSVYAKDASIDTETDENADESDKLDEASFSVDDFADSISNLILKFENVVEVKKTLFRRAINHIAKTHNDEVVEKIKDRLKEVYEISDETQEDAESPRAAEAGPIGSGGGGGSPV